MIMIGVRESLFQYLKNTEIVIPRIQRDYAQGRKGKTTIRKDILSKVILALEKDSETLTLDFVYGTIEKKAHGNVLKPLDGQQRLTTLWLIHWYISFRAGCLINDSKILRRFSYETRSSSREFVQALCNEMKNINPSDINVQIGNYIQNQSWFYNEWKYDPTIASMLRMISGDGEENEQSEGASCIEKVFDGKTQADFLTFRESLFDEMKVEFFVLEIENKEVPVPDKLYIKMNARGKKLSDFENFKAHFLGHVNEVIYKNDLKSQNEFSKMLDGEWTNIIWDWAKNDENKDKFNGYIDGIFFSFINRLVLNEVLLDQNISVSNMDNHPNFVKLYGSKLNKNNPDDRLITYDGFEPYKNYITGEFIKKLEKIMSVMRKDEEYQRILLPKYDNKDKDNRDNHYPTATSQAERCEILAYWIYANWNNITSIDTKKDIFTRWIHIVDNIITNSYINTVSDMVYCIREIKQLGDFIGNSISASRTNLYDIVKNYEPYNKVLIDKSCNDIGRQVKEEIEKAKKISEANSKLTVNDLDDVEKKAFFKGSIRFLVDEVQIQEKEETTWDWTYFDERKKNANLCFANQEPFIPAETYKKFITYLYEKNSSQSIECMISPNIVDTDKGNFKRQYMRDELEDIRDFLKDKNQKIDLNKQGLFYDMINSGVIENALGEEKGKYQIKTEKTNGFEICVFYKVVQNSSSYVYVDKNHKKWSKELYNIISKKPGNRSVVAKYYDKIGYFGKTINITIDGKSYIWTVMKFNNELRGNNKKIEWSESDNSVSLKDKLKELGANV